jgi:hypothetical protein
MGKKSSLASLKKIDWTHINEPLVKEFFATSIMTTNPRATTIENCVVEDQENLRTLEKAIVPQGEQRF